jgi:DedD protein
MAKQLTDDEQNLKRKARRRLIGAFALTLVVVVVLPMVLDSEPKPTGQDIDLRIPSADKVGAFVPNVVASKVAVELPASSPVVAPASTPVATLTLPKEPVAIPNSEKFAQPKADAKPTSKDLNQTASAAAEQYVAQVGAYSKAESAQKILANLKKWSFKAYIEKVGDKVRVRVGPYPEREKAEKVRQLLEKHGLHPVIIPIP